MGFIYKITNNINGKMYIGQTISYPPELRWKEHIKSSKREDCKNRCLYRAINKYKLENFTFEVIEEVDNHDLDIKEQYYINIYRTFVGFKDCNGYNMTLGGESGCTKIFDEKEVVLYHIVYANYNIGETAKHFETEINTIKKVLCKHNIHWLGNKSKNVLDKYEKQGAIVQVDPTNTYIVNMFSSITDANRYFGLIETKSGQISRACNGEIEKAYDFYWYKEIDLPAYIIKDERLYDNEYINKQQEINNNIQEKLSKKKSNNKKSISYAKDNPKNKTLDGELWKGLIYRGEDLSWRFEVSNLGRIRNAKNTHIYIPHKGGIGYYQICTNINNKNKNIKVHRAVAETFIPNPNNYRNVLHKDGDRSNNTVDNLEWKFRSGGYKK